ncbi:hypothetical protein ACJMK2_019131 [Sinanodonta woodiana]|uniref:VWFD domain-containing protein n=1 Tax=Sinanodonta woodiana TaxID=1069815 RepID=A0ABD3UGV1_SINWO
MTEKVLAVFVIIVHFENGQNWSGYYKTLPDLERRGINYISGMNEPYLSDASLAEGWYNVGDRRMTTSSSGISVFHCATYFPIWMKGEIPTENEGDVERTACSIGYFYVCDIESTIRVKNCSSHVLYRLGSTNSYSAYYSFGNTVSTNQTSCKPKDVHVVPDLQFKLLPVINSNNFQYSPYSVFKCAFTKCSDDRLFYIVSWYANDVYVTTKSPQTYSRILETNLLEEELVGLKMNIMLKCTVRASDKNGDLLGNITASSGYWIGIQVINPIVDMKKGDTATVYLNATFPLGCTTFESDIVPPCLISIYMFDPIRAACDPDISTITVNKESKVCGTTMKAFTQQEFKRLGSNWTSNVGNTSIKVTTKNNDKHSTSGRDMFKMSLLTDPLAGGHRIVANNYLGDITVTVRDDKKWESKNCYAHVDPHFRTADGSNYDNHIIGEYVMYRHRLEKQEVQIKTTQCNGGAACVCATSIRAGADMYIINLCGGIRFAGFVSCDSFDVLEVREAAYSFEVYMPLGTKIAITIQTGDTYRNTMNVDIYPSVKDWDSIEGMCGTFNGNTNDDFNGLSESAFADIWKIKNSNSSFLNPIQHNPSKWTASAYLCFCPYASNVTNKGDNAANNARVATCSASQFLLCPDQARHKGSRVTNSCPKRNKRSSTNSQAKEIRRVFSKATDEMYLSERTIVKRSSSEFTEAEAKTFCENEFRKSSVVQMKDLLPESTDQIIENAILLCIADIMFIGDTSYTSAHIESVTRQVDNIIERDVLFRQENATAVLQFNEISCVKNCSGRGQCKNGSCVCSDGYLLQDCSLPAGDAPELTDIFGGGACSLTVDDCCRIKVYGDGFARNHTQGRIQIIEVSRNGSRHSVGEVTQIAVAVESVFVAEIRSLLCSRRKRALQDNSTSEAFARGFTVSMSNDNINYGKPKFFFEYDSNCQEVSTTAAGITILLMANKCFIDQTCYSNRDKDPADVCNICKSEVNGFVWTDGCAKVSHIDSEVNRVIVAVSVSAVVAVILIVILVTVIKRKCFRKNKLVSVYMETHADRSQGDISPVETWKQIDQ